MVSFGDSPFKFPALLPLSRFLNPLVLALGIVKLLYPVRRKRSNVARFLPINSNRKRTQFVKLYILGNDCYFRKGFYLFIIMSINNRNLQLLSFQKIYTLLGVLWNMWPWSSDYARLSFGVHWYLKIWFPWNWQLASASSKIILITRNRQHFSQGCY